MDVRQVMAGVLTFSMFIMLGNMIKRDHFDSAVVLELPPTSSVQFDVLTVSRQGFVQLNGVSKGSTWKEHDELPKPCWSKPSLKWREPSKGLVVFSLSGDPEYHVSQVADAVVVARHLGATLVLPDIIGNNPGERRKFGDIYDVEKFVRSMNGVIQVAKYKPPEVSSGKLIIVRVPNMVSEDYIDANIEPLFRKKRNLRLATYFPALNMRKVEENKHMNSYSCLAMFEALQLQPAVQEVVDMMVGKLRMMSSKSNVQFIAVDLRVEMLGKVGCRQIGVKGIKNCYNAVEIGQFLKKIGFHRDTIIYLTQSGWNSSLDALKEIYPNTYTKEELLEEDKNTKYISWAISEFGKVIDFHVCSRSDVFVPAISGLFYTNVVASRIASGKTQVLVPTPITSTSASDHISPYISKKSHFAYSCFC